MAEVKGPLTVLNNVIPSGLDPGRLAQWRLRGGTSYVEFRNRIVNEVTDLNLRLLTAWSRFATITDVDHFRYSNGGAITDVPDATDLDKGEDTKTDTVGHMIDLRKKLDSIGGTKEYFRDVEPTEIDAQIDYKRSRFIQTFEKSLLNRIFLPTETLLNTSGYAMPFCTGSVANVAYAPPAFGGKTFDTSHDHYNGYATASYNFGTFLDALADHVAEHGHNSNLLALVSGADVASYRALGDNFVKPTGEDPAGAGPLLIDRGGNTTGSSFFRSSRYGDRPDVGYYFIGWYMSTSGPMTLYATNRVPTGYAFVGNSYGMNAMNNPIAIRIHPDVGFGIYIAEIPSFDTTWPVKEIEMAMEYGVAANKGRTNGAVGYLVAGGAWVNPTIS